MAYIGKTPVIGNFVKLDSITTVNGQAAYTMQNGGVNFTSYDNVNQFLVSLNGVLQAPTDSFTVSGSTLTFASNLSTGDVIDFVLVLGNSLDIGTPSDNTVSLAKLTATGTKDATTFLRGDNTFGVPPLGGITEADQWRLTANVTSDTDITSNLERNDSTGFNYIGTGMTESSGIFSFPSTGIYLVETTGSFEAIPNDSVNLIVNVTTDNSSYTEVAKGLTSGDGSATGFGSSTTSFIFDVTNVSTHKVKFSTSSISSGTVLMGNTSMNFTYFNFIRLGDT